MCMINMIPKSLDGWKRRIDTSIVGAGVDPALTSSSMTETCLDEVVVVTVVNIDVLEQTTRRALARSVATFKG